MSRQFPHAPASRPLVLGLTMVPALLNGLTVSAQTVTLQQQVIGQTPNVIGINSGNFLPEGNSSTFYRWLGVNGSRTFTSAPNIEPANADDIPGVGDGVNSQASFLRNNESDFINYDFAYSEFEANDINALAIINRTNNQFPIADIGSNPSLGWAQRYEHWQHYYAQAYYLGDNHGVERFSVFNEPDASSQNISQEEFLLRLQLASDAIQAALADVNRDNPDRNLEANVIAPITAGGANEYFRRLDNSAQLPADPHLRLPAIQRRRPSIRRRPGVPPERRRQRPGRQQPGGRDRVWPHRVQRPLQRRLRRSRRRPEHPVALRTPRWHLRGARQPAGRRALRL